MKGVILMRDKRFISKTTDVRMDYIEVLIKPHKTSDQRLATSRDFVDILTLDPLGQNSKKGAC